MANQSVSIVQYIERRCGYTACVHLPDDYALQIHVVESDRFRRETVVTMVNKQPNLIHRLTGANPVSRRYTLKIQLCRQDSVEYSTLSNPQPIRSIFVPVGEWITNLSFSQHKEISGHLEQIETALYRLREKFRKNGVQP